MQYYPEYRIGFSYVPSDLMVLDFSSNRGAQLQTLTLDILKAADKNKK